MSVSHPTAMESGPSPAMPPTLAILHLGNDRPTRIWDVRRAHHSRQSDEGRNKVDLQESDQRGAQQPGLVFVLVDAESEVSLVWAIHSVRENDPYSAKAWEELFASCITIAGPCQSQL